MKARRGFLCGTSSPALPLLTHCQQGLCEQCRFPALSSRGHASHSTHNLRKTFARRGFRGCTQERFSITTIHFLERHLLMSWIENHTDIPGLTMVKSQRAHRRRNSLNSLKVKSALLKLAKTQRSLSYLGRTYRAPLAFGWAKSLSQRLL